VLALRDIEPCRSLIADEAIPVIPAPFVHGRLQGKAQKEGFRPTSFADLMACNGFSSLEQLSSMVRAWEGIIDVVRPYAIVGAYSPVLALAAFERVPLALIGYSYTLPPAHLPTFPIFNKSLPPYADQEKLLELVRRVQKQRGERAPDELTEFYRGDARFVLTFPEVDPYRTVRREPPVGPLEDLGEMVDPPGEPSFYAYLVGNKPFVPKVLEGLMSCGLPGAIYMRDSSVRPSVDPKSRGIYWLSRPPPLSQAVTRATVIVHHGGANTFHWALGSGRPQVLSPRVLDQTLSANQGQQLGVCVKLDREEEPARIAEAVQRAASGSEMVERAVSYARGVRSRKLHNSLERVVEGCMALLP